MDEKKTGTNWFDLLPKELELIEEEDLIDPGGPINKNEEVIGEMTLKQRKIYTLLERMSKELDELAIEAKYSSSEKQERLIIQIEELGEKVNIIREIFFISLKDHFGIWEKMPKWRNKGITGIGVRANFKVVKIKERKEDLSFFRFLFGD